MIVLEGIHKLIDSAESDPAKFPPTLIFNEGWMLRLILDWYSRHKLSDHPLQFQPGATWFSEALLPSPFKPRYHGDKRGESRTPADGIIGHISIGESAKSDVKLHNDATQLIVVEAKMYSPLSGGTRNAPNFNQAARNVACITELLYRANRPPSLMTSLAFFVVAPEMQTKYGFFTQKLNKDAIRKAVQDRAKDYSIELGSWVDEWFFHTLEIIQIEALSWESLNSYIESNDPENFQSLQEFYERCLIYNGPRVRLVST
jgi:hypothetical protein